MNKHVLCLLFLIVFGCSSLNQSACPISEDEKIADEIIRKVAIDLMRKTGLKPCGSGGQMMDQVKMLALSFTYNKPIEIEEGRKLLVTAVETFVSEINSDERIHPYLYHYPFEPKNVEVMIIIQNPDSSPVKFEELCVLTAIDGNCKYKVRDSTTKLLKTIHNETVFEAKQKLNDSPGALARP